MQTLSEMRSVPAAELTRNFGQWQDRAARGPIYVTHHGRPRVVLLSIDDFLQMESLPAGARDDDGAQLRVAIDQMEDGLIVLDERLCVVRANPAATLFFKRSAEDMIGRSFSALGGVRINPVVDGYLRRAALGEASTIETPSTLFPGCWVRLRMFPLPGGVACLFRNISGERAAGVEGAHQSAIDIALGEHGRIGTGRISLRGTFAEADDALVQLTGFDTAALTGTRLVDVLALDRRVAAREAIEQVLTGGGPRALDSLLLVNGGGSLPIRLALAEFREGIAIGGAALVMTAL